MPGVPENLVVREFFGKGGVGGDTVAVAAGASNRQEDITIAVVAKVPNVASYNLLTLQNSTTRGYSFRVSSSGQLTCQWQDSETLTIKSSATAASFVPSTPSWKLFVVRIQLGVKPVFGYYNFATGEWKWEEGTSAQVGTKSSSSERVWFGSNNGSNPLVGKLAVAMVAPVMTQAKAEELAKVEKFIDWEPTASGLWFFDQPDPDNEPLEDLTGGGANQNINEKGSNPSFEAPPIPYYNASFGKLIKVVAGGVLKEVRRWVLVGGELIAK